jgi:malate dehydrogenase (oxaloacetate-decarboxylating)
MDYAKEALAKHFLWKGKLDIEPKMEIKDKTDLSIAYTPGVAAPCLEIQKNIENSFLLTGRANTIAVVTDGTAVLGLGDIGPEAGMPVMEGKCVLFKIFGGVNAFPLCIKSKNVDDIVNTVALLSGSFGGINLEDISAPRCFEIEAKLRERCNIPIFHDDQHGTAVVVLAAMINALKVANKKIEDVYAVIAGAGAAGVAITRLLIKMGLRDVVMCDRLGAIYEGRKFLNQEKSEIAKITNKQRKQGSLADVIKGSDVFIGVSGPNIINKDMVKSMAQNAILFPMANPTPEIFPEEAIEAGAKIIGTGRSDYPNQINNVLAFPAIFRGALDARACDINDEMCISAAEALAGLIDEKDLNENYIIASPFDTRIKEAVSKAVFDSAVKTGVAHRSGL